MRNTYNSELYGPLQEEYLKGQKAGTDVWIHKNRFVFLFIFKKKHTFYCVCSMSGLWGYQTALDLFLQENGITTLLFSGVNSDQVFEKNTYKSWVSISYCKSLSPIVRLGYSCRCLFPRIRLHCYQRYHGDVVPRGGVRKLHS